MKKSYPLTSEVIVYPGQSGWRFLALPSKEGKEIKDTYGKHAPGWGSLPVSVTIGATTWETSIFPDTKSGTYLLPLKLQVRKKEGIYDGDKVRFVLTLR